MTDKLLHFVSLSLPDLHLGKHPTGSSSSHCSEYLDIKGTLVIGVCRKPEAALVHCFSCHTLVVAMEESEHGLASPPVFQANAP